jgi:hypothetical protein
MKTFTHAGVSTLNGETKVRYANDALRVKVLAKGGHTDIDLEDLGEALTKEQAVIKLIEIKFGQGNAVIEQALEAELTKRTETPKEEKAPKAPKAPKSKPITLDTIKARAPAKNKAVKTPQVEAIKGMTPLGVKAVDLEDAPY